MGTSPRKTALKPSSIGYKAGKPPLARKPSAAAGKRIAVRRWINGSIGWAIAAFLIAIGGVAGSVWLGTQLMINPQALTWVNRWLPNWVPTPVTGLKPPQTLAQITAEIRQAGRIPGELLPLGNNRSVVDSKMMASDRLLPVLDLQPNCQSNCERIVELRLYQSVPRSPNQPKEDPRFYRVHQWAIAGPEESFVIAPLVSARSASQGSTRSLPLTTLKRFAAKSLPAGVWLNLSGKWSRGDNTVAYGTVIHYNPNRFHLSFLLDWNSTTEDVPHWRQVTGSNIPELVLNQTVGMEPQFKIFQVQPRNFLPDPIQLEPISLVESAFNHPTYDKALLLARSGLWSTGWQWLQSFQRKVGKKWSAAAQAQLDVVRWHAQATAAQANQSWASPNQQVLANLIDGRWLRALTVFQASPENSLETADLLRADSGRLLNRVEAALQVNPSQPEVKSWGALLIASQRGQKAAIAWLKKQPQTTATQAAQIRKLIKRIEVLDESSAGGDGEMGRWGDGKIGETREIGEGRDEEGVKSFEF